MDLDAFDHESHMAEALDCAREAAVRGDTPFGSVLVRDDEVVMRAGNRVVTENDLREHPELTLARRAAAARDDSGELVMYTSTEPCPMCAGGIDVAGLRAVVYSVSSERAAAIHGSDPPLSSTEVFAAGRSDVTVIPDVLRAEGEAVHEAHR